LDEFALKQAVRSKYAQLAMAERGCCQAPASSPEAFLPAEAAASAASCGTPLNLAEVRQGEVVLDLGSGAGIDVFRASKLVGAGGRVIGVDSTPEMIFKARSLAEKYGYANTEFRLGEIEHLPIDSETVDLVVSNCVINLVPDKKAAFKEIHRVLKPGGRIAISDIVAVNPRPRDEPVDPEKWAACIAGAVTKDEYEKLLRDAGFKRIQGRGEGLTDGTCCCDSGTQSITWLATKAS